jgi:hypothetical protein
MWVYQRLNSSSRAGSVQVEYTKKLCLAIIPPHADRYSCDFSLRCVPLRAILVRRARQDV